MTITLTPFASFFGLGGSSRRLIALRVNARQRTNGLVAHCAALSLRIKDGCVAIVGTQQKLLVCEYAAESRYKLATTVRGVKWNGADIEDKGLLWLLC